MNAVAETFHEPEPERQRTSVATTTPADLIRLALERNAPLEQIEKFMDLNDRWLAQQARKAFVQAMSDFKAEPIEILKNKRVHFQGKNGGATTDYKHAELSDVCDAIVPALAKHHLSHRWDVKQDDNKVIVTCILTHADGHSESLTLSAGIDTSGNKNHIQAIGSAATYLSRYTLLLITGLATKAINDDDGRGADQKNAEVFMTEDHGATIEAKCAEIGPKMLAQVLGSYKYDDGRIPKKIGEILDSEYESIIARLNIAAQAKADAKAKQ